MNYRLGIDAGSKTVKFVLLDEKGTIVFSLYRRHRSDIRTTMTEMLHETIWRFGDVETAVAITGSAGMRLISVFEVPFVQEVMATKHAVEKLIPQTDVAIELGGEDAKIIYFTNGVEQRMNATCAGGTGGFIDLMAGMLGVRSGDLDSLARGYQTIYPIASRCAVFAQADVRPLLNGGARRSDIAASVLQAVVTQTVAGLSCGRRIEGNVAFLGGPLHYLPELVSRFRKTLGLTQEQVIRPRDAHLFVATGAALFSQDTQEPAAPILLSQLEDRLKAAPLEEDGGIERLDPLFESAEELGAFKERHGCNQVRRTPLMRYTGDAYLGIDAGSTTVKLVLVDREGRLLYSQYEKTYGKLLDLISGMLQDLYLALPREYDGERLVTIRHTVVTGYGEQLLRIALNADSGVVETIAHLRAARELVDDVDFVLDIGGQDIKCMHIRDGVIDDVSLNEACSSGCGSLIEGFARALGYTQWSFSAEALKATRPVDLGTRCTVFMTSRVRHAQKEGISGADIAAGLAYSVVKNALFKVIGFTDPSQLGRKVVVQGGTFMSDAVLRAFELVSGCEAIRPDIANLMGAYGAALLARDTAVTDAATGLLDTARLRSLKTRQTTHCCEGCSNGCLLTINDFDIDADSHRRFVTGNRCERGAGSERTSVQPPNLYAYEQGLLRTYTTEMNKTGAVMGIPRVLDLYGQYPFWFTFFTELGYHVITIDESSTTLYRKGAHTVVSESVCYPAKVVHGHVATLIEQGADLIFLPKLGTASIGDAALFEPTGVTIGCPVATDYVNVVQCDVQTDGESSTNFVSPDLSDWNVLTLNGRAAIIQVALKDTGTEEQYESRDIDHIEEALLRAQQEQERFNRRLQDKADEALASMKAENIHGIVLAGHPYHVDPGLNHGIDTLLTVLGFVVFSPRSIAHLTREDGTCDTPPATLVARRWLQPAHLYQVADVVARHPDLDLVQLYSFGCGVDALSIGQARKIIEGAGKIFTVFKVDEIVDLAAVRIRLRSLAAALAQRGKRQNGLGLPQSPPVGAKADLSRSAHSISKCAQRKGGGKTILCPAIAPDHMTAVREVLRTDGHDFRELVPFDQHAVETGLKYVDNDLCYPMIAVVGQVVELVRDAGRNIPLDQLVVLVPQVCSACRSVELEALLDSVLGDNGMGQVEVKGFPSAEKGASLPGDLPERLFNALESADFSTQDIDNTKRPRIGILGNAAFVYTPFLNKRIIEYVEAAGYEARLPRIIDLLLTNAPLEALIEDFAQQGVHDIIYLQSFGCLSGHVHGRGMTKQLRQRYPDMNITCIDYDSGTSEVNQMNRIMLALAVALGTSPKNLATESC